MSMDRDTIIRLAREAGFFVWTNERETVEGDAEDLKRFAALVEQHERERVKAEMKPSGSFLAWENTLCNALDHPRIQSQSAWEDGYASGVAAEREACAKVCETRVMGDNNREDEEAKRCAAAIRSRT